MNIKDAFVEVDYWQRKKEGQKVCGDAIKTNIISGQGRLVICVADGLGSGIKANVLATLASTMAVELVSRETDIKRTAELIMKALPLCDNRNLGYSTFSIADIDSDGQIRLIEYDNPAAIFISDNKIQRLPRRKILANFEKLGTKTIFYSCFKTKLSDKIIICTDGVTESGRGRENMPFGWGEEKLIEYTLEQCQSQPDISARTLAKNIVSRAILNDSKIAKDDTSSLVINMRKPRKTLVVTGPPAETKFDAYLIDQIISFDGKKIICGGTTANIVARYFNTKVETDIGDLNRNLPPVSRLKGVDMVTEGTLTLTRLADMLESGEDIEQNNPDAAARLLESLLDSDIIKFLVGTKVNQVHQNPDFPIEMDLRRNLVKRLMRILSTQYLKDVEMELT
ncbi:MAG: SpoIIE family protein phosphatase [Sedimentisphaeraceae bacterium JB056]